MWPVIAALLLLQTPDDFEQGRKALEQNRVDQAIPFLEKAVASAPDDYAAHFHLGLALSLAKRDDAAIAEYQKTLQLKPNLYQAELNEGILLVRGKKFADAVPLLEDARKQKPQEFRPAYYLGEALLKAGDPNSAAAAFLSATALDAKSAAAQLGLGRALAKAGKLDEAAGHFEKAAQMDPQYQDALLELGSEYEAAKQPQKAIDLYMKFPENAVVQERMGALLIEQQRFSDAIPRLEQAVAASPTAANRAALAQAYIQAKDLAKATPELAKAVATEPGNFDLRMMLARTLRDQHQYVPAANQFSAATKLKPESAEAWNELAAVLVIHEEYGPGLAALDHVKSLGAEKPGDYFLRAISLDKLKQLKPALESYRQFLAAANGKFPDEEFQARQRARILEREISKR